MTGVHVFRSGTVAHRHSVQWKFGNIEWTSTTNRLHIQLQNETEYMDTIYILHTNTCARVIYKCEKHLINVYPCIYAMRLTDIFRLSYRSSQAKCNNENRCFLSMTTTATI